MKKVKIFAASLAFVGAAVAGTVSLQNQSGVDMPLLSTIEALARAEGTGNKGPGYTINCLRK